MRVRIKLLSEPPLFGGSDRTTLAGFERAESITPARTKSPDYFEQNQPAEASFGCVTVLDRCSLERAMHERKTRWQRRAFEACSTRLCREHAKAAQVLCNSTLVVRRSVCSNRERTGPIAPHARVPSKRGSSTRVWKRYRKRVVVARSDRRAVLTHGSKPPCMPRAARRGSGAKKT
jgi:hypothetical protein